MTSPDNPTRVPLSEIDVLPDLNPPRDPVFMYLLGRALCDAIPVFIANVPVSLIQPFAPNYDPCVHPAGRAAVIHVANEWRSGRYEPAWVYPSDDRMILSDDYLMWAAALARPAEYMPCCILGAQSLEGVCDVEGPIGSERVRELLGFG